MISRAIVIQEQAWGTDSPLLAPMRDNLAELCRLQTRMLEAERLFRGTLALLDRTAQPSNDATARTLNKLATLLRDQGRCTEAEPLYKRALELARKTRLLQGPDRAAMMRNYAILLRSTHRRREAAGLEAQVGKILADYRLQSGAGLVVDMGDLRRF